MTELASFPRTQRLKKTVEFKRVLNGGAKRTTSPNFVVLCCHNTLGMTRLGISISKRCYPKAVARNWLKRQLRERFRHCHHGLPSLDMVWLARHGIASSTRLRLRLEIEQLWQQLHND